MNGYNGNRNTPSLDFEALGLLVFRDFEVLKDQAFQGAARAHASFLTAKIGQHQTVWSPEPGHIELMTLYRQIAGTPSHALHRIVKSMDVRTACEYLKFKFPTLYIGSSLSIRNTRDGAYDMKHKASFTVDSPCIQHFTWLKDEIKSWNLFEEYGRVIMFSNEHHSYTPIHRDWQHQDEFIWIGLTPGKKFFVYDEAAGEKHFVAGRAITFNNSDYHGSDPDSCAGLSIRVDGVFTDRVRQALKEATA